MIRYFICILGFALLFGCNREESDLRAFDEEKLALLYDRIVREAESPCIDAGDWRFVGVGVKACGGPVTYIAYPKTIDVEEFLALVQTYNETQCAFNVKYTLVSDCMYVMPPKAIVCEGGKPALVYN